MSPGTQFQSVLVAAQAGAEWALTGLYRHLHPRLLRYLRAHALADAEDLASDVWLDVARGIGGFEGEESAFRAWFFTIAHRRLVDLRRQRARRREDPVAPELLADARDPTDYFSGLASESALAHLAALPPEQAEIVLLRVVAGLDSNEVGEVTGKKPGTVRVLQKRALERLAALVADESRSGVTP
jgi:RNA polymerase sigma-70 factor (ECF subfamily)